MPGARWQRRSARKAWTAAKVLEPPEGAEAATPDDLYVAVDGQCRPQGRRSRRLSGTARAARAAHAAAHARPRAARKARRPATCRSPASSPAWLCIRGLLSPAARRQDRRHRRHRQGRHHPYPGLRHAGNLRHHARALHRCRLGRRVNRPQRSGGAGLTGRISVIAATSPGRWQA